MIKKWYSIGISDVEKILKTNAACGLSNKAARSRIRKYGKNNFFFTEKKSSFAYVRSLLSDPIMLLLIGVTLVAAIFKEFLTAVSVGVVLVVHLASMLALYRSSYAKISRISSSCRPKVRVIRDGKLYVTDSENVTVGDVLMFEAGDIVPCDVRIVQANSLKVNVFLGQNSEDEYVCTENDPALIYGNDSTKEFYEYRNMLYAGSSVLCGCARGIVVECGNNTYIGVLDGGIPINDSAEHPKILSELKTFSKIYGLILLVAILPLTVVGIFSFGYSNMLGMFLLSLSVLISALCDLIYVIGNIISANILFRCAKSAKDAALIKSPAQLDTLAKTDTLILIGDSAFADKKLRLTRIIANGKEYRKREMITQSNQRASELLLVAAKAVNAYPSGSISEKFSLPSDFYDFSRAIGVDLESITLRFSISSLKLTDTVNVSVTEGNSSYSIYVSENEKLLRMCFYENVNNENCVISAERRENIEKAYQLALSQGCKTYTLARYVNGNYIFEGMFVFKRFVNPYARTSIHKLADSGIRTEVFLKNTSSTSDLYEGGFVSNPTEIAYAVKTGEKIPANCPAKAYIGYSYSEIKNHIERLKKNGRKVAVYDINTNGYGLFEIADICITADSSAKNFLDDTTLQSDEYVLNGNDYSDEASQILRFASDVSIPRADVKSGGLASIYNSITSARFAIQSILFSISYLLCSQVLRVAFVIPSFILGIKTLNPVLLLIGGLWIDIAVIVVLSLSESKPEMSDFRIPSLKNPFTVFKKDLTCSALAAAVGSVCTAIAAIITKTDISTAVFISVSITQLIMFFKVKLKNAGAKSVICKNDVLLIAFVFALALISLILYFLFSTSFTALSLTVIPVTPAIYFALSTVFGARKK